MSISKAKIPEALLRAVISLYRRAMMKLKVGTKLPQEFEVMHVSHQRTTLCHCVPS